MNKLLLLLAMVLLVAAVAAQKMPPEEPPAVPEEAGHCGDLRVRMLQAATDPADPQQEGYLRAAEAYGQLAALGLKCP